MDTKDRPLPSQPIREEPPPLPHLATNVDSGQAQDAQASHIGPVPLSTSHSTGSSAGSQSQAHSPAVAQPVSRSRTPLSSILKPQPQYQYGSRHLTSSPEPELRDPNSGQTRGRQLGFASTSQPSRNNSGLSFRAGVEAHGEDDMYAEEEDIEMAQRRMYLERRYTQPLPPLPQSWYQHPYSSGSVPTTSTLGPSVAHTLSPLPTATISRREIAEFPVMGAGTNHTSNAGTSAAVSRQGTLDPTPYGSVGGNLRRQESGARRLSIGPTTAMNANGGSRNLERRASAPMRMGTGMGRRGTPDSGAIMPEDVDLDVTPTATRTVTRTATGTELDWIVPLGVHEKPPNVITVSMRLEPTLRTARNEKRKASRKGRLTTYALNIAIGLQILLGALTTGLSVVIEGKKIATMTAILGGFSTIVASYIARVRGSNEPEKSMMKAKDLTQFIREAELFDMDFGRADSSPEEGGEKYNERLIGFRERLEDILKNGNGSGGANGETHRWASMFGYHQHVEPPSQPPQHKTEPQTVQEKRG